MREFLIDLDRHSPKSLQAQLREFLVSAILAHTIKPGEKLPSSRHLSRQLGISRNTVVLVYQGLTDDGYLRTAERSGYFVGDIGLDNGLGAHRARGTRSAALASAGAEIDWANRFVKRPTRQVNIVKPQDWKKLDYPFIYGQPDASLFPITDWRDCVYKSMGKQWLDAWSQDTLGNDDPMLIEQIRSRILPRRGILASEEQILVTLGAQHAIYLAASLLVGAGTRVGIENPGYPDARNIFALRSELIRPIPIDREGMVPGDELTDCDLVYTTPSHQLPTTVTMPAARRKELLAKASAHDFIIIEDDYELESSFSGQPIPALKSTDRDGRVIYVGSFSKTLFPGLRLGFVVAPQPMIEEMRAQRRLMVRHPPANNQRSTAFFLSLGYYDVFARRLNRVYHERWETLGLALRTHFPSAQISQSRGGSSYWLTFGPNVDCDRLARRAIDRGILIEPGGVYSHDGGSNNSIRLGFSSIATERIAPGVDELAKVLKVLAPEEVS